MRGCLQLDATPLADNHRLRVAYLVRTRKPSFYRHYRQRRCGSIGKVFDSVIRSFNAIQNCGPEQNRLSHRDPQRIHQRRDCGQ